MKIWQVSNYSVTWLKKKTNILLSSCVYRARDITSVCVVRYLLNIFYLVRWVGGQRDSYTRRGLAGGRVTTDRYRHWYWGWTSSWDQQYQLDGSNTTITTEKWNLNKNIRNRGKFWTIWNGQPSTPEHGKEMFLFFMEIITDISIEMIARRWLEQ